MPRQSMKITPLLMDANFNLTHVGFVNDGESSVQKEEVASFSYEL